MQSTQSDSLFAGGAYRAGRAYSVVSIAVVLEADRARTTGYRLDVEDLADAGNVNPVVDSLTPSLKGNTTLGAAATSILDDAAAGAEEDEEDRAYGQQSDVAAVSSRLDRCSSSLQLQCRVQCESVDQFNQLGL